MTNSLTPAQRAAKMAKFHEALEEVDAIKETVAVQIAALSEASTVDWSKLSSEEMRLVLATNAAAKLAEHRKAPLSFKA